VSTYGLGGPPDEGTGDVLLKDRWGVPGRDVEFSGLTAAALFDRLTPLVLGLTTAVVFDRLTPLVLSFMESVSRNCASQASL